ncbi:hypothetical protein F1737_07830 [Methanoplanus sp. FWC-SCC4]|uniref:Uncharacterized protein n=1 Tax=Methanochimaera problematica TaxID=2609417 RepID=A0AA97FE80_9EURY|nr:hypothetical protein [Methanoplanus sp. FWC-SCC4]WOF16609.1 hypothetical protein F1737_07830 [Methanoplanus sp. FWC-SCC4]
MEEMPEYQICMKCGKRSTPYMKNCWKCGTPFFLGGEDYSLINPNDAVKEAVETVEPVIEVEEIMPCKLDEMGFSDKIFAYSLMFRGDIIVKFCGCEKCRDAYRDLLAFFRECSPEDEAIIEEVNNTDFKDVAIDLSVYGF